MAQQPPVQFLGVSSVSTFGGGAQNQNADAKRFFLPLLVWLVKHWCGTNHGLIIWSLPTFRARMPIFYELLQKKRLSLMLTLPACVWFQCLLQVKWALKILIPSFLALLSSDASAWQWRTNSFVLSKAALWNERGRFLPKPQTYFWWLQGHERLWVFLWSVLFFSFCLGICSL